MPGGSDRDERLSLINLHNPFGRVVITDIGGAISAQDRRTLLYSYTFYAWPPEVPDTTVVAPAFQGIVRRIYQDGYRAAIYLGNGPFPVELGGDGSGGVYIPIWRRRRR